MVKQLTGFIESDAGWKATVHESLKRALEGP